MVAAACEPNPKIDLSSVLSILQQRDEQNDEECESFIEIFLVGEHVANLACSGERWFQVVPWYSGRKCRYQVHFT